MKFLTISLIILFLSSHAFGVAQTASPAALANTRARNLDCSTTTNANVLRRCEADARREEALAEEAKAEKKAKKVQMILGAITLFPALSKLTERMNFAVSAREGVAPVKNSGTID